MVVAVQEQVSPALTSVLAFRKVPFPRWPVVCMMKTMLLLPPGEWSTHKSEHWINILKKLQISDVDSY